MAVVGVSHDPLAYGSFIDLGTQYTIAVLAFMSCVFFAYVDKYVPRAWYRKFANADGTRQVSTGIMLGKIGRLLFCLAIAYQYSFGFGSITGRIGIIVGILWVMMGAVYVAYDEHRKRNLLHLVRIVHAAQQDDGLGNRDRP